MQREIFLLKNEARLVEFLNEFVQSGENVEDLLGIGFYSTHATAAPNAGCEVEVIPSFLRPQIIEEMTFGNLSPLSPDPVLIGMADTPPLSPSNSTLSKGTGPRRAMNTSRVHIHRWLMAGLHKGSFEEPQAIKSRGLVSKELGSCRNVAEAVDVVFQAIFSRTTGIRASVIVLLLECRILTAYFVALGRWLEITNPQAHFRDLLQASQNEQTVMILREILRWISEDSLQSRVVLTCDGNVNHYELLLSSRSLIMYSDACRNTMFRL